MRCSDVASSEVELSRCSTKHNELQRHTATYKTEFFGDVLQRCSTDWNGIIRLATDVQRKATNRHDLEPCKTMQNEFKLHYNKTLLYDRLWCSSFEIYIHYHISVMIMRFTAKSWQCDPGFGKIHSIVATERWPFCLGLNVLNIIFGLNASITKDYRVVRE